MNNNDMKYHLKKKKSQLVALFHVQIIPCKVIWIQNFLDFNMPFNDMVHH